MQDMKNDQEMWQELIRLEKAYRHRFPHASDFDRFSFGPNLLIEILREANGREIVFTYPGLDQGVVEDGGEYSFKEVVPIVPDNCITLQELLYTRHQLLEKGRVKIVRHLDTKQDLHALYRKQPSAFLDYQRQQGKKKGGKGVFHDCDYIISFLGEEGNRARFIGVYQVKADIDSETEEHYYYNMTEVAGFESFKERVIIGWGNSAINWHQWFRTDTPKYVLEIQSKPFSRPFTDYLDFTITFSELQELVRNQEPRDEWRRMLSSVSGIYLILDTSTGHHYIGSAYGKEGGIWERWKEYAGTNGHGNNIGLKELTNINPQHAQHFQFTLLMTLPRTMSVQEVISWENLFKKKISPKLCRN